MNKNQLLSLLIADFLQCIGLEEGDAHLDEIFMRMKEYINLLPFTDPLRQQWCDVVLDPNSYQRGQDALGVYSDLKGAVVWPKTGNLLLGCMGFSPMKLAPEENWQYPPILVRHAFDVLFSLSVEEATEGVGEQRIGEINFFLGIAQKCAPSLEAVFQVLQRWAALSPRNPIELAEWIQAHRATAPAKEERLSSVLKFSLEELRDEAMESAKGIK